LSAVTRPETPPARPGRGGRTFHAFVIAGGLVNAAVVLVLLAYWLMH